MKKITVMVAAAGLIALSACHKNPQEQAADNIQANAENAADNLEAAADNSSNEAVQDNLQNQADATRNMGDNMAEDMKTHDPDTNLANGM